MESPKSGRAQAVSSVFFRPVVASLLIVTVAAVLGLQFLIVGVPMNGDAPDHVMYQYHFSRQFWSGDFYPRWLAEANKGYGSPIFLGQYPFPYFVTALLRPVLHFTPSDTREARELGVFCFLMLAGAGLAAYYWFRIRCTSVASAISAVTYMSLPYFLGAVLYDRMALGELATFVWMPLLLALCDRASFKRLSILSALAIAFGLLLTSNILTAILFVPVLVLYAAASGRRTLLSVAIALAFGVCVAAVYMLPALAYQGLFTPGAFVTHRPLAQLGRNLLYVSSSDMGTRRSSIPLIVALVCLTSFVAFQIVRSTGNPRARRGMLLTLGLGLPLLIPNFGPKLIGLSGLKVSGFDSYKTYSMSILFSMLFTVGLGCIAYCRISGRRTRPQERVLLLVFCCAFVLMLPWAAVVWRLIPKTEIIQFPWRFCSIVTVAVAGIFAVAMDDCLRRDSVSGRRPALGAIVAVVIIAITGGFFIWRPYPHYSTARSDVARWFDPMYLAYVPPEKLYAFAESMGVSPDNYELNSTPVEAGVSAKYSVGHGIVSITRVTPEKLLVSAQCPEDSKIEIGQLYFPLWKVMPVTGTAIRETLGSSARDLMEVSLTPGNHEFWLVFGGGLPERLGAAVSAASLLIVVAVLAFTKLRGGKFRRGLDAPSMSHDL